MYKQNDNFNKRIKNIFKVPNRNYGAEEHRTELKIFNRGIQSQIRSGRRKKEQTQREDNRIHPIIGAKRKTNGKQWK